MSDPYIKAICHFMSEALFHARAATPEDDDHELLDEMDSDCKVNWFNYADSTKWKLLSESTEGNTVRRTYGGTEEWMPGYLWVDETSRNGMTAIEVFPGEPPEDYKAPGVLTEEELDEDDDDYDSRYDSNRYAYYVNEFPCRLERTMRDMIRRRPVVPNSATGPTLPPPDEYVEEEVPKPEEYGGWA